MNQLYKLRNLMRLFIGIFGAILFPTFLTLQIPFILYAAGARADKMFLVYVAYLIFRGDNKLATLHYSENSCGTAAE